MECIFCKIVNKEIPSEIVYEDDKIVCFYDLNPQAPTHALIIPRKHISSLDDTDGSEPENEILGYLISKVRVIADLLGLQNGYRLVCNCGSDGLQTVGHLHFHLIGGRQMKWPPG
jgi:histidine triad (HIT) family protein